MGFIDHRVYILVLKISVKIPTSPGALSIPKGSILLARSASLWCPTVLKVRFGIAPNVVFLFRHVALWLMLEKEWWENAMVRKPTIQGSGTKPCSSLEYTCNVFFKKPVSLRKGFHEAIKFIIKYRPLSTHLLIYHVMEWEIYVKKALWWLSQEKSLWLFKLHSRQAGFSWYSI